MLALRILPCGAKGTGLVRTLPGVEADSNTHAVVHGVLASSGECHTLGTEDTAGKGRSLDSSSEVDSAEDSPDTLWIAVTYGHGSNGLGMVLGSLGWQVDIRIEGHEWASQEDSSMLELYLVNVVSACEHKDLVAQGWASSPCLRRDG